MNFRRASRLLARSGLFLLVGSAACATARSMDTHSEATETAVTTRASGTFEVRLTPASSAEHPGSITLGRMTIDKVFHGDLAGTGQGELLTALTPVASSAGYVAMERVSGTLHGRTGSFVLQHTGTMTGGDQELAITVVPDTGTGELIGLSGRMRIVIEDGVHSYEFEYTLSATAR